MKPDQERVKKLLKDTVTLLCKNGLFFEDELRVEGVLGITCDNNDVFIVHINEKFECNSDALKDENAPSDKERALSLLKGQTGARTIIDQLNSDSALSSREIAITRRESEEMRTSINMDDKISQRSNSSLGSPASMSMSPSTSSSIPLNQNVSAISLTLNGKDKSPPPILQNEPQDLSIKEEPSDISSNAKTDSNQNSCQLSMPTTSSFQDEMHLMRLGYSNLLDNARKRHSLSKSPEADINPKKRRSLVMDINSNPAVEEEEGVNGLNGGAFVAGVAPNLISPGQWPMIDPTLLNMAAVTKDGPLVLPNAALWAQAAAAAQAQLPQQNFTPSPASNSSDMYNQLQTLLKTPTSNRLGGANYPNHTLGSSSVRHILSEDLIKPLTAQGLEGKNIRMKWMEATAEQNNNVWLNIVKYRQEADAAMSQLDNLVFFISAIGGVYSHANFSNLLMPQENGTSSKAIHPTITYWGVVRPGASLSCSEMTAALSPALNGAVLAKVTPRMTSTPQASLYIAVKDFNNKMIRSHIVQSANHLSIENKESVVKAYCLDSAFEPFLRELAKKLSTANFVMPIVNPSNR